MTNAANTAAQAIDRSIRQNGAIVQLEHSKEDFKTLAHECDRSVNTAAGTLFAGVQGDDEWQVRMSNC